MTSLPGRLLKVCYCSPSQASAAATHQIEHLLTGFILDPTGQLKARANSLEFDISPMTLKVVNLNKYLVKKQLIFELLRNTNTMSVCFSS